jgi:predicted dehydrogenase
VYARGKILAPIRGGYEVIIPDLLNVLCRFENGAEGVLEFSGVNAHGKGDRLEIYGDRATLTYDFANDVIEGAKSSDEKLQPMQIPPELEGGWTVEEDFLAAVKSKGRVRPHPDFEEGVRYMRVVQAVADSRAKNAWIDVSI